MLDEIIGLLESFIAQEIQPEDFMRRYRLLRIRLLSRLDKDSLKQQGEVIGAYRAGDIDYREFKVRMEALGHQVWAKFDSHNRKAFDLFAGLVSAIDTFDAPDSYGDLAIDEAELRNIVKQTLDRIQISVSSE